MQPFPLYHLPYLAFKEVLKTLELNERLSFSLCSAGSRRLIKSVKKDDSWQKILENKEGKNVLEILQHLRLDCPPEHFAQRVFYSITLTTEVFNFKITIKTEDGPDQFYTILVPIFALPLHAGLHRMSLGGNVLYYEISEDHEMIMYPENEYKMGSMECLICDYFWKYLSLTIDEYL